MRHLTALGLMGLFIITGCGKTKTTKVIDNIPWSSQEPVIQDNPSVLADDTLSEGMALLITKKYGSLGLCTSFLISENHLLTNSHCITDVSLTENCSESIVAHIRAGNTTEYRTCKKIVTKSSIKSGSFINPDYAVIELSSAVKNSKPKPISREGILEGSELTVESIDYSQLSDGTVYGKKKISKCSPQKNSLLGNFFDSKSSIIPLFEESSLDENCRIIQGNSGSPVLNSENKVVSVLFATVDKEKLESMTKVPAKHISLATNLSCQKLGLAKFDLNIDPDCERVQKEEKNYAENIENRLLNEESAQKAAKLEEFKKSLPSSIEFEMTQTDSGFGKTRIEYNFKPKCIHNLSTWNESEQLKIKTSGVIFKKKSYATKIPSYSHVLELSYDEYMRPIVKSTFENLGSYDISIVALGSMKASDKIEAELYYPNRYYANRETVQIPVCQ